LIACTTVSVTRIRVNLPCGELVSDFPRERILEVEGPELGREPHPVMERQAMTTAQPQEGARRAMVVFFMGRSDCFSSMLPPFTKGLKALDRSRIGFLTEDKK
jgi:hypothetical protein